MKTVQLKANYWWHRYRKVPNWSPVEVDTTGRWRLTKKDVNEKKGEPVLQIECFILDEYQKTEKIPMYKKGFCQRSFLDWLLRKPRKSRMYYRGDIERVVRKIRADVQWVSEDNLNLIIKEDFPIQTCDGDCE